MLKELISRMRSDFDDFNPPASPESISHLRDVVKDLPEDAISLYSDHDGSPALPRSDEDCLPVRLMPISEVLKTQPILDGYDFNTGNIGRIAWLWTDDQSNYVGVYTSGILSGWCVRLDHEQQSPTPAYRSVASFFCRLLDSTSEACDAVTLPREVPLSSSDPEHIGSDRKLVQHFNQLYSEESDEDRRRFYAFHVICLTPVEDTASVLPFMRVDDIWIPEAAVKLLAIRGYTGAIDELETLARDGRYNGDAAAVCQLLRIRSRESRAALKRLKGALKGEKVKMLQQWLSLENRMLPPRWD